MPGLILSARVKTDGTSIVVCVVYNRSYDFSNSHDDLFTCLAFSIFIKKKE